MGNLPHEKQIQEYVKAIEHLKKQSHATPLFQSETVRLEQKLEMLKKSIYSSLTPAERITICRHPNRPHAVEYIQNTFTHFHELHGDRTFRDDPAVVGGLAKIGDHYCVVIGQEKGHDTESRMHRNFGMLHPEGFRKALRLMQLAEKFSLPVITLIDTQGAYPCLEAEERGQGWAIAMNLREMAVLSTPIIVLIIGEGCSGGALGMGVGDTVAMLQHAYYSVISPEGCASILWKDASKHSEAAAILKLTAEDLMGMSIIDAIIPEPLGGAHYEPKVVYDNVRTYLIEQIGTLKKIPLELLLEQRYLKFRKMGALHTNPAQTGL